jgi:hypothetical protein
MDSFSIGQFIRHKVYGTGEITFLEEMFCRHGLLWETDGGHTFPDSKTVSLFITAKFNKFSNSVGNEFRFEYNKNFVKAV